MHSVQGNINIILFTVGVRAIKNMILWTVLIRGGVITAKAAQILDKSNDDFIDEWLNANFFLKRLYRMKFEFSSNDLKDSFMAGYRAGIEKNRKISQKVSRSY